MAATLAIRVVRLLKKKGYFQDELLPELQAASVQSRIADRESAEDSGCADWEPWNNPTSRLS